MAIGVQRHLGPVRVVEGPGGRLEILVRDPARRPPGLPQEAGEALALAAQDLLAAPQSQEPLVPIVARLLQRQGLGRVVGAPADRERDAMGDTLRHEGGRNVGGSGTPIMAYHGEGPQAQRIGELDHIQPDGRKLARAHGPVRAEPRRPAAAKIGRDRAPARARQRRANAVPGSHVVGPAVQQQDRGPIRRAAAFNGDIQDGCGGVGEIVHQLLPGTRTWDVRRGIPVDPRTLSCSRC